MKIKVIFRKYPDGEICALFPEMPHDVNGRFCMSYAHVGQHGAADPAGVVRYTVPATRTEYGPLMSELRRIGYSLRVCARISRNAYAVRQANAI